MAFRERIEAIFKAKDAARFKTAMDLAAKAVGHLERQEQQATVQSELLEQILEALEHQTYETAAAMALLSHEVNALGHDMLELAADTTVANTVMKKSGSNAVFLGKSWAFWKDRLSLTRSEIYTTALTIGVYLAPALIALGSSFAYAAIGGGGVAAAGMTTFIGGLLGIISIASPVVDGLDKIDKAHQQLNIAIDQYGAASIQASRANGRLYAIIQNNGGPAVAHLRAQIDDLKDSWKSLTAPGQASFIDMISQMLGGATRMAPFAAGLSNQVTSGLRAGVLSVIPDLTGGQARSGLSAIADIFRSSIGPGIRGVTNLLMIFFRVIRASGPWVKRLSTSFERLTKQWRDKATMSRVSKFFNEAVNHFRAWWALARALGRTLGLVIKGSRKEGASLVVEITRVVNKFNDWLEMMENTGRVDAFFEHYINSLKDVVWALQHPMQALDKFMPVVVDAINKYLPRVMDAIANTLASHGPTAAGIFLKAFVDAGAWAKFLTVAVFAAKFGFFGAVGRRAAAIFVVPFVEAFAAAFAAQFALQTTAGGTIAGAMSTGGQRMGTAFGKGMILGVIAAIPAITYEIEMAIINSMGPLKKFYDSLGEGRGGFGGIKDLFGGIWDDLREHSGLNPKNFTNLGKAAGGMIFPGQSRWVGERGPEIAQSTAHGTMITPGNRAAAIKPQVIDIPDLSSAIRLISNVSVQVDRREIARAVSDQRAYDAARRGQEE